jgi:hypothetical protein
LTNPVESLAVPDIELVNVFPETASDQLLILMVAFTANVPTVVVTAQVCPLVAVAVEPVTVKLTSHMSPFPWRFVATCVGSTLVTVRVAPVREKDGMLTLHVASIEPEPKVQLPAKAAAGSPAIELLPQPSRNSAAAAPHTRTMDDFVLCMIFSVGKPALYRNLGIYRAGGGVSAAVA